MGMVVIGYVMTGNFKREHTQVLPYKCNLFDSSHLFTTYFATTIDMRNPTQTPDLSSLFPQCDGERGSKSQHNRANVIKHSLLQNRYLAGGW